MHGLNVVECKVVTVDYVVVISNHRKLGHVNMLKEYHEKNGNNVEAYAVVITSSQCKPEMEVVEIELEHLSGTGV